MRQLIYLFCVLLLLTTSGNLLSQESVSPSKAADGRTANSSAASASRTATQTTWIIVRHAEKDAAGQLNEAGKNRAKKLKKIASLFRLEAVYATDVPRTHDTAKPTAVKIGVDVQKYPPLPEPTWFAEMKTKHAGQTVLIVGHSNTVEKLVSGFGGTGGFSIAEDEYDNLFIVANVGTTTQSVRLSYGDKSDDD